VIDYSNYCESTCAGCAGSTVCDLHKFCTFGLGYLPCRP